MANEQVQLRRGTTAEHSAFVGAVAELTVDTTKKALILHDGVTVGGKQMAAVDDIAVLLPPPSGRLTLSSGTAIPVTDTAGASSVFYTPSVGNSIPIYDGARMVPTTFAELTLALTSNSGFTNYHQSGQLYDFFVINDGGTLRLGTGPKWTSPAAGASSRGTGAGTTELEMFNGYWVNKNTILIRFGSATGNTVSVPARRATFVGTGCMTANGQIDDSKWKRLLSNAYNRVERLMHYASAASYSYSTATLRQVEGSANSQLNFVLALPGPLVDAFAENSFSSSTATLRTFVTSIGLNQTTALTDTIARVQGAGSSTVFANSTATYKGTPPAGLNFLAWLEQGAGSDVQTVFNNAGQTGISGTVMA